MVREEQKKRDTKMEEGRQEKTVESQQQRKDQVNGGNKPNKKRKQKELFPFGNYRNYYGYRIAHGSDEDPRLKFLKNAWLEGKDCLDIGCNCGVVTIQIAKKFNCCSILGIDIDAKRIQDAYWHLRKFMRLEYAEKERKRETKLELLPKENASRDFDASRSDGEKTKDSVSCSVPKERDLSQIVSFKKENFVLSQHSQDNSYDTILCLSVSKWIHLNWGDDGLITLFSKAWKLLRPGGVFILEPQPWKSYENNRRVSETTAMNYRKIFIRPEHFREILLDKIGFRAVEDITSSVSGSNTGFDRPIFVYRK